MTHEEFDPLPSLPVVSLLDRVTDGVQGNYPISVWASTGHSFYSSPVGSE